MDQQYWDLFSELAISFPTFGLTLSSIRDTLPLNLSNLTHFHLSAFSSNIITVEKAFWLLLVSLPKAAPRRSPPSSLSQHPGYFRDGSNHGMQLYCWLMCPYVHCLYLRSEYKLYEARGIIYFVHGFVLSAQNSDWPTVLSYMRLKELRDFTALSF